MLAPYDLARLRVDNEDARKREKRINRYKQEIERYLKVLSNAKEYNQELVHFSFSSGPDGDEEANRVRESLVALGYECGEIETYSEFKHGVGDVYYLSLSVKSGAQVAGRF